jgi:hypothetical protein
MQRCPCPLPSQNNGLRLDETREAGRLVRREGARWGGLRRQWRPARHRCRRRDQSRKGAAHLKTLLSLSF